MMTALIRLTRPYYSFPLACGLIVISLYVAGGDAQLMGDKILYAFLALFFILSAGYTLNDVCDMTVDAVNSPGRLLPMRQLTRKTALISAGVLFALGIGLAAFCGWQFFSVLILITVGVVIYDLYSKKMGIIKPVLVAVLTTSLYPLSFALTDPNPTPRLKALWIFPMWLFLTTLGYEMLKDIRDMKGDRLARSSETGSCCADPRFLLAARGLLLAASLLTLLPYLLGYCQQIYLISSCLAVAMVSLSLKQPPVKAIPYIYAEVFLITAGSWVDLLVYGP